MSAELTPTVVRLKRKGGEVVQGCDVYIGRAMSMGGWALPTSRWANPYTVKLEGRDGALAKYEAHVRASPELMAALPELRGKCLGCWCAPDPCHGNVLVKLMRERRLC